MHLLTGTPCVLRRRPIFLWGIKEKEVRGQEGVPGRQRFSLETRGKKACAAKVLQSKKTSRLRASPYLRFKVKGYGENKGFTTSLPKEVKRKRNRRDT